MEKTELKELKEIILSFSKDILERTKIVAFEEIGDKFIIYAEDPNVLLNINGLWDCLSQKLKTSHKKILALGLFNEFLKNEKNINLLGGFLR